MIGSGKVDKGTLENSHDTLYPVPGSTCCTFKSEG